MQSSLPAPANEQKARQTIPTYGRIYTVAGLPRSDYTMDAVYEHGTLTPLACAGTAGYIIAPKGPIDPER